MKTMKRMSRKTVILAAVEDKALDSRSYTADWSAAGTLNTKRIVGTMVRLR